MLDSRFPLTRLRTLTHKVLINSIAKEVALSVIEIFRILVSHKSIKTEIKIRMRALTIALHCLAIHYLIGEMFSK